MKRRSLRIKLLLAMFVVITAFWLTLSCVLIAQTTRERSGWVDQSLSVVAHQILSSLPADIGRLSADSTRLSVPDEVEPGERSAHDVSFQIWAAPDTGVLRSRDSPESPLAPDFQTGFSIERIGAHRWRVYSVADTTGRIYVQTGLPMDILDQELDQKGWAIFLAALILFLILSATLWLVVSWFTRPLRRLQHEITARREYDLTPLSLGGLPVEIKPLIESFNRMLVRIDRAINNERRFIADAAHELRTPMAAVQTHAQVALNATGPEQTRAALNRLIDAVQRGTRLAQQLLDSARLESGHESRHETLDLAEIVSIVTHEFDAAARQHGQSVSLKARSCNVSGNVDELGILLRNLLDNALRYSGEGSRIEVRCGPDNGGTVLRVGDNGPGIPDARERQRIFERFFRTGDSGRRGSGIGLSLVRRIAESHGANLGIDDGLDGRGISIEVRFPPVDNPGSQ